MRKENVLTLVLSVLATLVALTPVGYMAYRAMPPRLVTVDLQKLVEEQQAQAIDELGKSGGTTTDERRQAVQKLTVEFAKKLSATVDALGAECNCVIVNKAAVLAGVTGEYTDLVRERMKRSGS